MKASVKRAILLLALTAALAGRAEIRLPSIFSDGMVLQREMPVRLWGWADAGNTVTVTLDGATASAVADASGKWLAELPAMGAGGPYTITVADASGSVTVGDVLVGEVWLASGQSNMVWNLKDSENGEQEVAQAVMPKLRLLWAPNAVGGTPWNDIGAAWRDCTPDSARHFSAVGYYFGRRLAEELDVPVGIISSSWGGTRIEPWTPPEGFRAEPKLRSVTEWLEAKTPGTAANLKLMAELEARERAWLEAIETARRDGVPLGEPPVFPDALRPVQSEGWPWQPTCLYNSMIHPFTPYAMRGAIWYQGENNVDEGMFYAARLRALQAGWSAAFRNPDFRLYIVQLAPCNYGEDNEYLLPELMAAQAAYALEAPGAHTVVINDVGNVADIHPRDKKTVGNRLAERALKYEYNRAGVACDYARATGYSIDGACFVIDFDQALATALGAPADWFEVAGDDGVFYAASAAVDGSRVRLTADQVPQPVQARFAWNHMAEPNLRNAAGLPVGPFQIGDVDTRSALDLRVPEAKDFTVLAVFNPLARPLTGGNRSANYIYDVAKEYRGVPFDRVAYFWEVRTRDGETRYLYAAMDPFTDNPVLLGVPVTQRGARFQQGVANLTVLSDMPGVAAGDFAAGNIEFWDCNYGAGNAAGVPGASGELYDFGDAMDVNASPGYGSMQLHNTARRETVFAYNHWKAAAECDLGFGNRPEGHPDWTFSGAGGDYQYVRLTVLARFNPQPQP